MFQRAIEAAAAAASSWTPERADPDGGCCALCLLRYADLVLDGPLGDLPHAVAHAAITVVDDIVAEQVDDATEELRWATWITLSPQLDRDAELEQRLREAADALARRALRELTTAQWRLDDLRRRCIDPAISDYLGAHPMTEVPRQWEQ